jgi:hypothetical protein
MCLPVVVHSYKARNVGPDLNLYQRVNSRTLVYAEQFFYQVKITRQTSFGISTTVQVEPVNKNETPITQDNVFVRH